MRWKMLQNAEELLEDLHIEYKGDKAPSLRNHRNCRCSQYLKETINHERKLSDSDKLLTNC